MHRTKILRALIASVVVLPLFVLAAKVDVFKEFETKTLSLEKSLAQEKDIHKRYESFLKTFKEISELRKNNPRQAEDKEINMSFFMDALAALPGKAEFLEKNCTVYVKEVETAAKAYKESENDPYSDRAVRITKLICRK